MKRSDFLIKLGAGLLLALSVLPASANASLPHSSAALFVAYAQPRSYYEAHVNLAEPEQARIRRHLATIEAELRTRPMDGLNASQRIHRLARLDDLHAYWTRGEFPKNLDFPDRLVPYFIDAAGVPCAMGYLVIASGAGDFAQEIERTGNNAYIGEIAAVDPRLAQWAEENGMTLEEAAMVQPSYGPPALSSVLKIGLDTLGRPWAFGPDRNSVGPSVLFYQDSSKWKLAASGTFAAGFCVTSSGLPLVLQDGQVAWQSRSYGVFASNTMLYGCAWTENGSEAWVGSRQGLVRLRRQGAADTLAKAIFKTLLGSDTVTGIAVAEGGVWAGTARGVYRRGIQGSDTSVTAWDSTVLFGKRVTGLKASGSKVWLGLDGVEVYPWPGFSTRGVRRYNGSTWTSYVAAMSSISLPGDTVMALAIRDTGTAWIAVRSGFYKFPVSSGSGKVADIPAGVTVFDMAGDSLGFYAGTSQGVYQFRNDSLVFLGAPGSVGIRPGLAGKGFDPASRLRVLSGRGSDPTDIRSLLGRKAGPRAGAGVYVIDPPK